jgi:hypothetical protein
MASARSPGQPSPAERSLRARVAAHMMHARYDARVTTANGRAAFLARFEREVDPDGRLDPEERTPRSGAAGPSTRGAPTSLAWRWHPPRPVASGGRVVVLVAEVLTPPVARA